MGDFIQVSPPFYYMNIKITNDYVDKNSFIRILNGT